MSDLLTAQTIGDGAHRVVFLHGLMGRGKNWAQIARGLGKDYTSLLLDLPNHGTSAWTESFDYRHMADMVAQQLAIDFARAAPVDVVGHSMGGKVAMYLALRHPELVRQLVIVDISPAASKGDFDHLLGSLLEVDLSRVKRRLDAQEQLEEKIPNPGVRGFLLQNLNLNQETGASWENNLAMLYDSLETIMGWEGMDAQKGEQIFTHPVLWIKGENSDYISSEDSAAMRELFPKVRKFTVKGAGHWVHSEKPAETIALLQHFLSQEPEPAPATNRP